MREMGIVTLYRHPRTTQPHPGQLVFPYLLRDQEITLPNQVWAMDLTYLPMRHGFRSLVAVLDWATRRVLAWRLSNTLTTQVCRVALVQQHGIRLVRDGKGAWRDSLFVERLWKSVEYEEVYLHAYDSVAAAHQRRARYFTCYTSGRPHSALDGRTPDTVYFGGPVQQKAA